MYTVKGSFIRDGKHETILDALRDNRVFSVRADGNEEFTICEECDDYFNVTLTKEQLIALADELRAFANGA